jgi:hypothetical protein
MGEYTAIIWLVVSLLSMCGTFIVWLSKLGSRVQQLENKVVILEGKEQKVVEDINSIKISLARIETLLGTLINKERDR